MCKSVWTVMAAAVFCIFLSVGWSANSELSTLESGFGQPPQPAKPLVYWFWINGNITKQGITDDLTDMKRVGIGGVLMLDVSIYLPKGPVRYGTDNWYEHVMYAIQTCDKLGLEFYLMNCPGWSGSAGPWITPELSMKTIVWSETDVNGPSDFKYILKQPQAKLDFYKDIAVLAVPSSQYRLKNWESKINMSDIPLDRQSYLDLPDKNAIPKDKVLNLTQFMDSKGELACRIPQGSWTIIRFGYTTTGSTNHPVAEEGHGLEVDKFDPDAVSFQFDKALGRIIRETKPYLGKTFKGIHFDSFEGGYQNWTEKFPAMFKQFNGYDIIPYLPVLTGRVIESQAISESVLCDFRHTQDELLAKNYFRIMQRLAHKHNLIVSSESQGGPLNPFFDNEYTDIPMNEFWIHATVQRKPGIKQVVSAADMLGRKVVAAEAFTAKPEDGKWQNTPYTLKKLGDAAFTMGINRFVLHTYVHQPFSYPPGFTLGRYGTHFGRLNTWWKYAPEWISYLNRSGYLLQQGRLVTDICFLFHDDIRRSFLAKMIEVPDGYDFDICYPRHLAKMECKDNVLVNSYGQQYHLLVLPDYPFMTLPTLKKVYELAKSGIIISGRPPENMPGLKEYQESQKEFKQLVSELWEGLDGKTKTSKSFGKGKLYWGKPLEAVLKENNVAPDIQFAPAGQTNDLLYIHRATENADIYFISNQKDKDVSTVAQFRINKKVPEFWDSATGKIREAKVFNAADNSVSIPLNLDPYGSMFVVFSKPLPKQGVMPTEAIKPIAQAQPFNSKQIEGSWKVKFLDGRGAPAEITMDKLISWPEHPDSGVKYYSGTAEYEKTVSLPNNFVKKDAICLLDLGEIYDVGEVLVNGQEAGVLWKKPYKADITKFLKSGDNTISIKITNRWINRLIGDEQIPVDYMYRGASGGKFTAGALESLPDWLYDPSKIANRKRYTFTTWKHYSADSLLVKSGLIGPVKLSVFREDSSEK